MNFPSQPGSSKRIRSSSGGCVENKFMNDSRTPLAKKKWLASSAFGSSRCEPAPPTFFNALARPIGIARELHGRGISEKFALPAHRGFNQACQKKRRCNPITSKAITKERQRILSSPRVCRRMRPKIARHRIPNTIPMSRRFSRMSPLRIWLNSWPMTPCNSSRVEFSSQPRVAEMTTSLVEWPAAKALIPFSCPARRPAAPACRKRWPFPRRH